MAENNINSISVDEINKSAELVKNVMSGFGNQEYEKGVVDFFKVLGNAFKGTSNDLKSLIQELHNLEKESQTLSSQLKNNTISLIDYVKKSADLSSLGAGIKGQISILQNQLKPETLLPNLDDINKNLFQHQTFFAQLTALHKSYSQDVELINSQRSIKGNKVTEEALNERKRLYEKAIMDLADGDKEVMGIILNDLTAISEKASKEAIQKAKAVLTKLKELTKDEVTFEMLKDMEAGIQAAEKSLGDKADKWKKTAEQIQKKVEEVSKLLKSTADLFYLLGDQSNNQGNWLNEVGDYIMVASNLAKGAADIAGGIAMLSTNPIGGATAIVQAGTNILKTFKDIKKENDAIRKSYKTSQAKDLINETKLNKIIRERIDLNEKLKVSNQAYYDDKKAKLESNIQKSEADYNKIIDQLKDEKYIKETKYKHGTLFRKAKTWNVYEEFTDLSYEKLEELDILGKLDGNAKTLFDQLKVLHSEKEALSADLKNLDEEFKELESKRKESLTGTTTDSIFNAIIKGFQDGKRSAADFADEFESLMKNAMMEALKTKFLTKELEKWYDDFAEKSESDGQLTQEEIEELRNGYNAIIEGFAVKVEQMEQIAGMSITLKKDDKQEDDANAVETDESYNFDNKTYAKTYTTAPKGFEVMTQESANELNRRFADIQMITGQLDGNVKGIHNVLHEAALQWIEIAENTRYCRKLETIEKDMSSMKSDINTIVLKGIRVLK